MRLPDISDIGIQASDIVRSRSAIRMVSGYAQLGLSPFLYPATLATLDDAAISDLQLVAGRANNWMNDIAPGICDRLPRYIVSMSNSLEKCNNKISAVLTSMTGLQNVAHQRQFIDGCLNELINDINDQRNQTGDVYRKLKVFSILTNDAFISLSQKNCGDQSERVITTYTKEHLGLLTSDDFIDIYGDDCCAVTAKPKEGVLDKATQLLKQPDETCFVFCMAVLKKMAFHVKEVEYNVQKIFESWTMLQKKYSLLITHLDETPGDNYLQLVQQLDFDAAQTAAHKLVEAIASFIK
jgi:hypothetical protein